VPIIGSSVAPAIRKVWTAEACEASGFTKDVISMTNKTHASLRTPKARPLECGCLLSLLPALVWRSLLRLVRPRSRHPKGQREYVLRGPKFGCRLGQCGSGPSLRPSMTRRVFVSEVQASQYSNCPSSVGLLRVWYSVWHAKGRGLLARRSQHLPRALSPKRRLHQCVGHRFN
jgi:hypothetical protein